MCKVELRIHKEIGSRQIIVMALVLEMRHASSVTMSGKLFFYRPLGAPLVRWSGPVASRL